MWRIPQSRLPVLSAGLADVAAAEAVGHIAGDRRIRIRDSGAARFLRRMQVFLAGGWTSPEVPDNYFIRTCRVCSWGRGVVVVYWPGQDGQGGPLLLPSGGLGLVDVAGASTGLGRATRLNTSPSPCGA
jgi:hypothetical protein